ncbi:hypothetical protein IJ579_02040, partial [bacterium]|nr:hypothetical protein [bacterium]
MLGTELSFIFTEGNNCQSQATSELPSSGKCRLGLLPQHIKFPSPLVGEGLGVRGVPVRGKHTATVKASSLRGRIEVGANPVRGKLAAFTKPSRATSKARDEQASTEALSFRCNCERWRLLRGAVPAFTLAEVLITLAI